MIGTLSTSGMDRPSTPPPPAVDDATLIRSPVKDKREWFESAFRSSETKGLPPPPGSTLVAARKAWLEELISISRERAIAEEDRRRKSFKFKEEIIFPPPPSVTSTPTSPPTVSMVSVKDVARLYLASPPDRESMAEMEDAGELGTVDDELDEMESRDDDGMEMPTLHEEPHSSQVDSTGAPQGILVADEMPMEGTEKLELTDAEKQIEVGDVEQEIRGVAQDSVKDTMAAFRTEEKVQDAEEESQSRDFANEEKIMREETRELDISDTTPSETVEYKGTESIEVLQKKIDNVLNSALNTLQCAADPGHCIGGASVKDSSISPSQTFQEVPEPGQSISNDITITSSKNAGGILNPTTSIGDTFSIDGTPSPSFSIPAVSDHEPPIGDTFSQDNALAGESRNVSKEEKLDDAPDPEPSISDTLSHDDASAGQSLSQREKLDDAPDPEASIGDTFSQANASAGEPRNASKEEKLDDAPDPEPSISDTPSHDDASAGQSKSLSVEEKLDDVPDPEPSIGDTSSQDNASADEFRNGFKGEKLRDVPDPEPSISETPSHDDASHGESMNGSKEETLDYAPDPEPSIDDFPPDDVLAGESIIISQEEAMDDALDPEPSIGAKFSQDDVLRGESRNESQKEKLDNFSDADPAFVDTFVEDKASASEPKIDSQEEELDDVPDPEPLILDTFAEDNTSGGESGNLSQEEKLDDAPDHVPCIDFSQDNASGGEFRNLSKEERLDDIQDPDLHAEGTVLHDAILETRSTAEKSDVVPGPERFCVDAFPQDCMINEISEEKKLDDIAEKEPILDTFIQERDLSLLNEDPISEPSVGDSLPQPTAGAPFSVVSPSQKENSGELQEPEVVVADTHNVVPTNQSRDLSEGSSVDPVDASTAFQKYRYALPPIMDNDNETEQVQDGGSDSDDYVDGDRERFDDTTARTADTNHGEVSPFPSVDQVGLTTITVNRQLDRLSPVAVELERAELDQEDSVPQNQCLTACAILPNWW